MFSKFKELIISEDTISFNLVDDDRDYEYKLDEPIYEWRDVRGVIAKNKDYMIEIDANWIYIHDKRLSDKILIYNHYDIKTLISKDIRKGNMFELSYRRHLRNVYSRKAMVVIQMNYIPDRKNPSVEKVKQLAEKYSYGNHSKPIVVLYYNDNDEIVYTIIKNEILKESGVMG